MLKLLIFLPLLFTNGHLQTNKPFDPSKNVLEVNSFNSSSHETCDYEIEELKLVVKDIDIQKYNISCCTEMTKDMAIKEKGEREKLGGPWEYILENDDNCENNDLRFALTFVSGLLSSFLSALITGCCVRDHERTKIYNIVFNFFTNQRDPSSIAMNPASTREIEEIRASRAADLANNIAEILNNEQEEAIRRLIRNNNY